VEVGWTRNCEDDTSESSLSDRVVELKRAVLVTEELKQSVGKSAPLPVQMWRGCSGLYIMDREFVQCSPLHHSFKAVWFAANYRAIFLHQFIYLSVVSLVLMLLPQQTTAIQKFSALATTDCYTPWGNQLLRVCSSPSYVQPLWWSSSSVCGDNVDTQVYKVNRIGDSAVPCGAPVQLTTISDRVLLSQTNCGLSGSW